jgi:methylthioribose-1-phosphate isomerase
VRTIDWKNSTIFLLDQTVLPAEERVLAIREVADLAEAIISLRVRGAMALGVAGGLGIALAIERARERGLDLQTAAQEAAEVLKATRPTAVNLTWGIDRVLTALTLGPSAAIDTAEALIEADIRACRAMAARGAALLRELLPGLSRVLTHCNTGALAAVEWGSALGVIRAAHGDGLISEVIASETRPLLQGSRLTAWELGRLDIPYRICVDAAGASLIASRYVGAVITGADRIAANGDVANKIGTYAHALAADRSGIPLIVVAPESTIDPHTPTGSGIPVEHRPDAEVLQWNGSRTAPPGASAVNPAFDVTPAELVTAIVTEQRVIRPAKGELAAVRP